MKKILFLSAVTVFVGAITGCSSLNIAKLPITERDQEVYKSKQSVEPTKEKIRIVIVPQNSFQNRWEDKRTLSTIKSLTNAFGDDLDTAFSNLSFYDVVPRNEVQAIKADMALSDVQKEYKIKNVNYIVVYRVSSFNFETFSSYRKHSAPSYKAYVKVKVTLIDLTKNVKQYTKTLTGQSEKSESQTIGLLNQAIENAVKDFSTQFAIDNAPSGIVLQTKGSAKVALISIGKNCGLMKKMKMEFFTNKKINGKALKIPFAYGKIVEIGKDTAWVEIDSYSSANVKQNNSVRIRRDQSRSFLEKL